MTLGMLLVLVRTTLEPWVNPAGYHGDDDEETSKPGAQATVALVLRLAIYHGLSMWEAKYGVVK